MHIGGIGNHGISGLSSGQGNAASGAGFQLMMPGLPATALRGARPSIAPSLGSQTVSALLQDQALQAQPHGHGGGGHGGMKTLQNLQGAETEEAAAEGATAARRARKMQMMLENGVVAKADQGENQPDNPDPQQQSEQDPST